MVKNTIFIFFLLFLSGCIRNSNHFSKRLDNLEKMVNDFPQQVLDSLQTIPLSQLNRAEQAHYYLLEAITLDKNYKSLPSDSSLLVASNYFSAHKDYYNLAKTQTYLAIHEVLENNEKEKAYKYLKEAESNFQRSSQRDSHILGLIYYWIAQIQHQQNNYEEAEIYYRKSVDVFKENKDIISGLYSFKELGWLLITKKDYEKAEEVLEHSILQIDSLHQDNNKKIVILKASLQNAQNFLYWKKGDLQKALEFGKRSISTLENHSLDIPSNYYYGFIPIFKKLNQIDSCKLYCTKLIETAKKENNFLVLINSYRLLFQIEEQQGNYQKACELRDKYNKLKDEYSSKNKSESFIELERKYNTAQKEKAALTEKNRILTITIFSLIFVFATSVFIIYLIWSHRKLKRKNEELEEEVAKTKWGYALSRELIADNSSAYEELERLLNQNIHSIPPKIFDKFQESFRMQKADYSRRIFMALNQIDNNFIDRLQKRCPDLTPEDAMLASMIRHYWDIYDTARVFRVTLDAMKKRKQRLKLKVLGTEATLSELDEFLKKM